MREGNVFCLSSRIKAIVISAGVVAYAAAAQGASDPATATSEGVTSSESRFIYLDDGSEPVRSSEPNSFFIDPEAGAPGLGLVPRSRRITPIITFEASAMGLSGLHINPDSFGQVGMQRSSFQVGYALSGSDSDPQSGFGV